MSSKYVPALLKLATRDNNSTHLRVSNFIGTLLDDETAAAARATLGVTGGIADGDYGDITVSGSGSVMNIDAGVVTTVELGGDITTAGKALLDDADASAQRTTLGLGTLATQSGTFSGTHSGTSSGTNTGDQNVFTTIAVSGQSNVVSDQASDTLTLAAGSNITITTNATTDTVTIAATVPTLAQTEIDFGSTPVESASFTITDANVTTGKHVIATVAYEAPTSKDLDELDCDTLDIKCSNGSGSFTMFVRSTDGSYLADKFKINYMVG